VSTTVWLIPLFPLVGALLNIFLGNVIGRRAHWVAVPALAGSFLASCVLFSRVASGETLTTTLFTWIVAGDFETSATAYVDPLSGVMLLRDLGPLPGTKLRHTLWSKGKLLVNVNTNEPLRASDVAVGSLTFVRPEGLEEHDENFQTEIAKSAVMVVRIQPDNIKDKRELEWSHEGIVAYSKICTHVGCPISLYEQQTHHVLCPCHQSTFDLSDGARVIFGPAGHALPQLRIGVNDQGYLEALGDFEEPVGPAFWERG